MPESITICNVPDQTRDELEARATRSGRSLEDYLRDELIALADKPDVETVLASIRERTEASETTLSVDDILAFRDQDRK